jgi:hypothetical protein
MGPTLVIMRSVREQVGGVLSYAAVPHGGLGPPIPPLCRYAEYTVDLLSPTWRVLLRHYQTCSQLWRLVWTAQRHQGGARRAGDSRGAVHTKCQSVHSTRAGSPVLDCNITCSRARLKRL